MLSRLSVCPGSNTSLNSSAGKFPRELLETSLCLSSESMVLGLEFLDLEDGPGGFFEFLYILLLFSSEARGM